MHNSHKVGIAKVELTPCIDDEIIPFVFVDKLRLNVPLRHRRCISGHPVSEADTNTCWPLPYRWLNLGKGKVAFRSLGLDALQVEFNPSALERGHNVVPFVDETLFVTPSIIQTICAKTPELRHPATHLLRAAREDSILLRAGLSQVSEIHLAADVEFATRHALDTCFGNLRRGWHWRRNRRLNSKYMTTLYFQHTHWTLVAYIKDDELESKRERGNSIDQACCNRLRLELRIRRQDIRMLTGRLSRAHPELAGIDLSNQGSWQLAHQQLVFDYYLARFRSRYSINREQPHRVPLFYFLAKHGGRPVMTRRVGMASTSG